MGGAPTAGVSRLSFCPCRGVLCRCPVRSPLAKAMLSSTGQSAVLLGPLSQALGAPRWQSPWQHSLTLRGTLAQGEGTGLPVFLSPWGGGAEDT